MLRKTWAIAFVGVLSLIVFAACQTEGRPTAAPLSLTVGTLSPDQMITIGDIDFDEPAKKIKRFQPLADYLAEQLEDHGIKRGQVVIARDIEEMAGFLSNGTVDIYFDSPFPALGAQELSGSEFILRRWKNGESSYWSTYVVRRDSGIASIEDLVGKVVAFEEPYSTSGFILPAGTLVQRGFTLRQIGGPDREVAPDEIGYFFARDEENTIAMVLQGRIAGGGISMQDYDELPAELKEQLITIDRTITVPRQIVSTRPGLSSDLVSKVRDLLIGLDQTEEGRQILEDMKKSKFDPLPPDSEEALQEVKELMKLVSRE